MASGDLPDIKQKQKLLYSEDTPKTKLNELGERFFQAAWLVDAMDCWDRCGNKEGLEKIRQLAKTEGDAFILQRCLRLLDAQATEEEWNELATHAKKLGKLQFAREGFRLAGNRKALDEIDQLIDPADVTEEPEEPAST